MAALPYMQFYVADYLADTNHLTPEEHGAYLLLIFNYWQRGKPLPNNPSRLMRITGVPNGRWTDVERTLSEYFEITPEIWRHLRIDEDLKFVEKKQKQAILAGKASAESRKRMARKSRDKAAPNGRSTTVPTTVPTGTQRIKTQNRTDTDYKKKKSKKEKALFFKKPTVQEIRDYCKAKSKNVDAESFYNFYESKGWMVGKNKMKNWHAAVNGWDDRSNRDSQNNQNQKNNNAPMAKAHTRYMEMVNEFENQLNGEKDEIEINPKS